MSHHISYALVTGASSGIGLEIAHALAALGYNLILVARRESLLKEVAAQIEKKYSVTVQTFVEDLSLPSAVQDIVCALSEKEMTIDIVVNNAGFGVYGPFSTTALEQEREMIQVNISALTELTKAFLPAMIERKAGRILNIASTAAFQPGPYMAVYFASKAYVLSFSEALASELEGTGVTVTALCPGPTGTGFQTRASNADMKLFADGKYMDARSVAEIGVDALFAGKAVAIAGFKNKLFVFLTRFIPRAISRAVVKRMMT